MPGKRVSRMSDAQHLLRDRKLGPTSLCPNSHAPPSVSGLKPEEFGRATCKAWFPGTTSQTPPGWRGTRPLCSQTHPNPKPSHARRKHGGRSCSEGGPDGQVVLGAFFPRSALRHKASLAPSLSPSSKPAPKDNALLTVTHLASESAHLPSASEIEVLGRRGRSPRPGQTHKAAEEDARQR